MQSGMAHTQYGIVLPVGAEGLFRARLGLSLACRRPPEGTQTLTLHTLVLVGTAAAAAAGHALIPDHWLPYVLTARARGLTRSRATAMAGTGALVHLASTVAVGVVFALAGGVAASGVSRGLDRLVGVVVIALGLYFVWRGWSGGAHGAHEHDHGSAHAKGPPDHGPRGSHGTGWDYTLGAVLGVRPCAEAIPIFLAASTRGVFSSLAAIGVWMVVTVVSMAGMVWVSMRGLEAMRLGWLERYGQLLSGAIIVAIGALTLL